MVAYKKQTLVDYTAVDAQKASAVQKTLLEIYNSNNAFDQAVVKSLVQYVDEQVKDATVDVDANLALLKLFLVYPDSLDKAVVIKVLAKAVMALPSQFFSGANTMISESLREDAAIQNLLAAGYHLQACAFEEFWKVDLSAATKIAGFTDASYSSISTSVLKSALNISDKEVKDLVAAENWTLEDEIVKIPANEDNQVRPKKDVLKVIHTLSR
ncbi:TPA: hypothetical protein N0F65_006541 [Lagenidium giganteum]|uniref:CSN8/PSMD8/EIF3K domain-containing protein n=1 Tax=Lagenidium giganteum TaxID=4803 RepID=A0AAV2YJT1_9STRA|nr:TPA: hypothetical protein N0F65_006541 [Lagenidium giganteum]